MKNLPQTAIKFAFKKNATMKHLHIFLLFAFTCLSYSLAAQDIIVKHNGDSLLVKVVEVGTS